MKIFDAYRLLITPLSPIHIGTGSGESYEPTNYVIDDGVLYEFDTGSIMESLTTEDREKLLAITNGRSATDMIKEIQCFFFERRASLMGHAIQHIPVLPGVAHLYEKRIGQIANHEADGKKILNRLEIDRTSFNSVTHLPVLFGSSLKGAIRTALLNHENHGASLQKKEDPRTHRQRDENNLDLQQRLFQYRSGKFELDPLRLVQFSDAVWADELNVPASQVYLAVNRKKNLIKDKKGILRKSQAESRDLYQILECIPGWHYRAFMGQLNLQSLDALDRSIQNHTARRGNNLAEKIPAADVRFDITTIARACNDFYHPILEKENKIMRECGYLDLNWDKSISELLKITLEKMVRGEMFLVRVGRHSGEESVTINGVRNIKIMKGKDQPSEYLDTTKTLWLAAKEKDQSCHLLPFGWILVEVQPIINQFRDCIELKNLCEPYLATRNAFSEKLRKKQAEIEQARVKAEIKVREEAEKTRLRDEEVKRKKIVEEEYQSRLAAMSIHQRRVEEFITRAKQREIELRGAKEKQNADFQNRARQLVNDALTQEGWTTEEKYAVAMAVEEWLPRIVERLDKKEEWKDARRKLKLSLLR